MPTGIASDADAPASRASDAAPERAVASAREGDDQAELELRGKRLTFTLADARAINAALLTRLEQQATFIEDRKRFIAWAQNDSPFIGDGSLNIAGWNLRVHDDHLQLYYRAPAGPLGMPFYSADLERRGSAWIVGDIVQGRIHRR